MPPRKLSAEERDALLQELVDAAIDQGDILARMEERLRQIERATSATPMAILRETLATIFADRVKTSAFFAFLTVVVVVGGALYLNSEAALIAVATQTSPDAAPLPAPPLETTP